MEPSGPASAEQATRAVELAARDSYGRLVAWLTSRCGDLARAEDALGDALERALESWPVSGVPDNPEAWLVTTARRRMIDRARRQQTRDRHAEGVVAHQASVGVGRLQLEAEEALQTPFRTTLPDRRLELVFVCAHPEIPEKMRTPLILQAVLGLDARRIGSAFLVAPSTMGQRLVRAKRRIRDLGLRVELPDGEALVARLPHVLDAIYAAYGTGWNGLDSGATGLAEEALWLIRLVCHALPQSPEALGLLALISYAESRRAARRDGSGAYVPLEEQDVLQWDAELILEGEKALWIAAKHGRPGPYQLEAIIQSLHAHRARTGTTDWASIRRMYEHLVAMAPSIGASIGLAAAHGRLGDPDRGLAVLDGLPDGPVASHQPYWAVRAHLLGQSGAAAELTQAAFDQAIGLCEDPAVRTWLQARRPD